MTEEQKINENQESEQKESNDSTVKKHRSPNYPYIGLEEAIERAGELQKVAGIHPIRVTTAWETWNYKKGAGNQIVAALDAYDLVSVEGIGDKRQIKLTLDARKILDNTSERVELLKNMALLPDLHKDIWEYFKGDLPPDNKVIREYLVYERNFNPSYVDKFIEQFKASLAFANVSKSDKIDEDEEPEIDNNNIGGGNMTGIEQTKKNLALPVGSIFKASIEVSANGALNVIFAGSMDSLTVGLLKDIYDLKEKYEPKAKLQTQIQQNEPTTSDVPLLESGKELTEDSY